MNKITPNNNINHSAQEKIIEKFEKKIEVNIPLDSQLREEWGILKDDWERVKKNSEVSDVELEKRSMCETYINQTANFIMKNILDLENEELINVQNKAVEDKSSKELAVLRNKLVSSMMKYTSS